MRSGAHALLALGAPLSVSVLRGVEAGHSRQVELRRATGAPCQATLRTQLRRLVELGALEKRRPNRFPGALEYELTEAGRELLWVADVLERWLQGAPGGPLTLGERPALAAIKALTEAWSATILRALAVRPLSLVELDSLIGSLSYPALERRLTAMRRTGQVDARRGDGRGHSYAAGDWVRQAIGPLLAAGRWERHRRPGATAPFTRLDVETAFLLALPAVNPPAEVTGCCRLAVEVANGEAADLAGVMAVAGEGRIVSLSTDLRGTADASALGPLPAWLTALVEGDAEGLELSGSRPLARALLDAFHRALFAPGRHSSPA